MNSVQFSYGPDHGPVLMIIMLPLQLINMCMSLFGSMDVVLSNLYNILKLDQYHSVDKITGN